MEKQRLNSVASSPFERFVVAALAAIFTKTGLEGEMEAIIDNIAPQRVDDRENVAGRPFGHWRGKTADDLRNEGLSDEQIAAVARAHRSRSLAFETTPHLAFPSTAATATETRKPADPPAPPTQPAGLDVPHTPPGGEEHEEGDQKNEPSFAGRKLSEFDGMSDEQLLELDGVGPATVKAIRAAQQAAKK